MAEAVKIRKKDIKEAKKPDVVLTHATSLFDWLMDNRKIVLGLVGALIVLIGAVSWASASSEERRKNDGAVLSLAIEQSGWIVAEGETDRAFPTEEAKQAAVGQSLAAARELGGETSRTAGLRLASLALDQGETDAAIAGFESFLEKAGSSPLRLVALEGLAAAYEIRGDYAQARQTYSRLGELDAVARSLYHQARTYELEGDKERARELYQQVIAEHESDSAASDARMRLDLLGTPAEGVGAF